MAVDNNNLKAPNRGRKVISIKDGEGFIDKELQDWIEGVSQVITRTDGIDITKLPSSVQSAVDPNASAAGRLFKGKDGDFVSFGGTYRTPPRQLLPDLSGLEVLPAGHKYDVKAIDVTTAGFTVYAKDAVVSGYATNNSGAGSFDGTFGGYTADKPITADAYDNIYTFDVDLVLMPITPSGYYDPFSSYEMSWTGQYEFYAKVGGTWVLIRTETVTITDFTSGYPSPRTENNYIFYIPITQSIGMVAGAEFGIKPIDSSAVSALNNVAYETQTTTTVTSLGTKLISFYAYL